MKPPLTEPVLVVHWSDHSPGEPVEALKIGGAGAPVQGIPAQLGAWEELCEFAPRCSGLLGREHEPIEGHSWPQAEAEEGGLPGCIVENVGRALGGPGPISVRNGAPHQRVGDFLVLILGQQPGLGDGKLPRADEAGGKSDDLVAYACDEEPVAIVVSQVAEIDRQVAWSLAPGGDRGRVSPAGQGGSQLLGHCHERLQADP